MPVEKKKGQLIHKFESIDDMRKFYAELNSMQGNGEEVALDFNIDFYSDDVCTKIVEVVEKTSRVGFKPSVRVRGNNLEFTKDEIQNLNECEDYLEKGGVELFISDDFNLYSIDETMVAYAKLRAVAEEIKNHDGSPFEKFLEIYGYVTSHIYKKNEENLGMSRDIIAIMNSDDIVCVGYAKLMEYLCKEVGIDCRCSGCDLFTTENEYTSSHQCNLVYMKDEKYGIDGWYHVDACWDAVRNGGEPYLNYNYCMIPIEDVKHSTRRFDFYYESEAVYGDLDELFIDYFKKPSKLKKCMEFLGLELDKKIPAMTNAEYNMKRNGALNILNDLLKKHKIQKDVYGYISNSGGIFDIESLIALCFDYKKNEKRIDYILNELNERYKISKNANPKPSKNSIDNVYEYLFDLMGEPSSEKERQAVKQALVILNNEDMLFNEILKMRKSSKPITMKKYALALKHNQMQNGKDEEQAEEFAKKAMKRTIKRAGQRFDDGATNAFKRKSMQMESAKSSS